MENLNETCDGFEAKFPSLSDVALTVKALLVSNGKIKKKDWITIDSSYSYGFKKMFFLFSDNNKRDSLLLFRYL